MRILFVFAHPDDEAYGPAGMIARLASTGNNVTVVSLCQGNRPGNEWVADSRRDSFLKSCKLLGATPIIKEFSDCQLEYSSTLSAVESIIAEIQPDAVYTHSQSDLHRDHKLVAECCLVACRPKPNSSIKELYFCETPTGAWSFGQTTEFVPNVFVDVTEYINLKQEVLELYSTEVYQFPDARSIEAVELLSKQRGYQSGLPYAEAFRLVFKRCT